MKDYKTLTREKVDAEPGAARYMGETHMMEDWSDKMIDLVLNGPTLNGFRKDEVRAILRQTYTALKQYEQIGPMASPYMNDPSAIVARAFAELYPGIDYHAQFVPDLCDESGNRAFGLTIFPDDGSTPIVCISAEAPASAAPELLAPIWIPAAIVIAVLLVFLIVVLVKEGVKQTEEKQRRQERSLGIDEQAHRYGLERQPGETDLELKKRIAFLKQAERRAGRR